MEQERVPSHAPVGKGGRRGREGGKREGGREEGGREEREGWKRKGWREEWEEGRDVMYFHEKGN